MHFFDDAYPRCIMHTGQMRTMWRPKRVAFSIVIFKKRLNSLRHSRIWLGLHEQRPDNDQWQTWNNFVLSNLNIKNDPKMFDLNSTRFFYLVWNVIQSNLSNWDVFIDDARWKSKSVGISEGACQLIDKFIQFHWIKVYHSSNIDPNDYLLLSQRIVSYAYASLGKGSAINKQCRSKRSTLLAPAT